MVEELGDDPAGEAEDDGEDVEQPGDQHQREEARHDQVLDRVDAEDLESVELLADLAGAEVGGDRGPGDAGDDRPPVTIGPIPRIAARTKKPPSRSSAPKSCNGPAACSPGAPKLSAKVETISGNQQRRRAKRNCSMSSSP